MDRVVSPLRALLWPAIAAGLGLLATAGFLLDRGLRELRAWPIAGLVVSGAVIALLILPRNGVARIIVVVGAAIAAGFLMLYDVLDVLLDPVLSADWPIAVLATVLTVALGGLLVTVDPDGN